jgi:hypothetical protein
MDHGLKHATFLKRTAAVVVTLINSAAIASSISGETLKTMTARQADWSRTVPAFLLVAGLQLALLWYLSRRVDRTVLREGSKRFTRFFASWYAEEGNIYIYCSDIEWLETLKHKEIIEKIKQKGRSSRAHLFVRYWDSPEIVGLLEAGVKVYVIPPGVELRIRMSLRTSDDSRSLIIRATPDTAQPGNNRGRGREVMVRTSSDQYLCGLARDLLRLCQESGSRLRLAANGQAEITP